MPQESQGNMVTAGDVDVRLSTMKITSHRQPLRDLDSTLSGDGRNNLSLNVYCKQPFYPMSTSRTSSCGSLGTRRRTQRIGHQWRSNSTHPNDVVGGP